MSAFQFAVAGVAAAVLAGCAIEPVVRQADLDSWQGMPVQALDTHPAFSSMPMTTRTSAPDIEVRDYVNTQRGAYCSGTTFFGGCVDNDKLVCHNLFSIKDGRVIEYTLSGQCTTNDSVRPEQRYLSLTSQ
ncbi:hypothetical protein [Comamonas sp. C24C]